MKLLDTPSRRPAAKLTGQRGWRSKRIDANPLVSAERTKDSFSQFKPFLAIEPPCKRDVSKIRDLCRHFG
jgi:hypothetical protein